MKNSVKSRNTKEQGTPKKSARKAGLARCFQNLIKEAERLRLPIILKGSGGPDRESNAVMEYEIGVDAELLTVKVSIQQQIMSAQKRARLGLYGVCAGCQKLIPLPRMDAMPYAVNCIVCEKANQASISTPPGRDYAIQKDSRSNPLTVLEVEKLL